MPVTDDVEATRKIRALECGTERHLHIVALTANTFEQGRTLCMEAGMDGLLAKPVSPSTLRSEVERLRPAAVLHSELSTVGN